MKLCVVVADRSRARLFVGVPGPERDGTSPEGIELQEVESLTNPEGELTGSELFSSTRSGTNRSPHGAQFEYDDHRERHRDEVERRFAKRIAEAVTARVDATHPYRLILAVEPRLLGLVRQTLGGTLAKSAEVIELAKDFSWHSPRHVKEALERSGVIGQVTLS